VAPAARVGRHPATTPGTREVFGLKVMIVDDHPVTRDGLRVALSAAEDIEVVGEAATGEQAVIEAEKLSPDIVLMDLHMPGIGGIEACRRIRSKSPDTRVILFTVDQTRTAITEALQAGVSGYLLKDLSAEELVNAARLAMDGKSVIHPQLTQAFIDEVDLGPRGDTSTEGGNLSKREAEILQKVAYGATTKEVAEDLGISPHTVKTHLERIFEKLGANDRAQAVAIAIRRGIVE
jgi:DNA-binding NarL/FixJ family response regulator